MDYVCVLDGLYRFLLFFLLFTYTCTFNVVSDDASGGAVLKFHIQGSNNHINEEAVGASLLLYVNRRRKMKKRGKGKKIFLQISKLRPENGTWESLTFLRTRVKKRRWKRISLPVSVAQQLLDSDNRSLDLKVKCIGCGRLVQLVFKKDLKRRKNDDVILLGLMQECG